MDKALQAKALRLYYSAKALRLYYRAKALRLYYATLLRP
jgi:hypothetical protein